MKRGLQITDNAVLQYLERVQGLDVDGVRDELARRVKAAVEMEANAVHIDGFRYVLRENVLVTVHRSNQSDVRTGRVRGKRFLPDD